MASFRCYDSSDVIAILIMTNFPLYLIQLKKTMWFIGVEVEQETSAPPPKKNPGSAPATAVAIFSKCLFVVT